MSSYFDDGLDSCFETFGKEAQYVSVFGDKTDIVVIQAQPDSIDEFSGTRVLSEKTIFEVRVSELERPEKDAFVFFEEQNYQIKAKPVRPDDERLIWSLECVLYKQ